MNFQDSLLVTLAFYIFFGCRIGYGFFRSGSAGKVIALIAMGAVCFLIKGFYRQLLGAPAIWSPSLTELFCWLYILPTLVAVAARSVIAVTAPTNDVSLQNKLMPLLQPDEHLISTAHAYAGSIKNILLVALSLAGLALLYGALMPGNRMFATVHISLWMLVPVLMYGLLRSLKLRTTYVAVTNKRALVLDSKAVQTSPLASAGFQIDKAGVGSLRINGKTIDFCISGSNIEVFKTLKQNHPIIIRGRVAR